ncbi:hypothetical protein Efla_006630 [Eimeria flavescens]
MALPPVLDEENLYKFRTKICERYVKQGKCEFADKCQYSHDLRWTRRPPWKYTYSPELCRDLVFVTDGRGRTIAKSNCRQKRNCRFAHTKEEQMYHPKVYKTAMCHQFTENGWCDRYYCPFAHSQAELRHTEQPEESRKAFAKPAVQEALCPDIYLPSDRPHPRLRARFLAIMDGIPSQNHLHLSLEPSYLSTAGGSRTRQPYTDFISSHTPHSVLSEGSPAAQTYTQQKEAGPCAPPQQEHSHQLEAAATGNRAAKPSAQQMPPPRQQQNNAKETLNERRSHRTTNRLVQLLQAKQYAGNTTGDSNPNHLLPGSLQREGLPHSAHAEGPRMGGVVGSALTAISEGPPCGSAYASTHSAVSTHQWPSVPGSPSALTRLHEVHVQQADFLKGDGSLGPQNVALGPRMAAALLPGVLQQGERQPPPSSSSASSARAAAAASGDPAGSLHPHPMSRLGAIFAEGLFGNPKAKPHADLSRQTAGPSAAAGWSLSDREAAEQVEGGELKAAAASDFRVKCLTSDICYWNEPIGRSRDDPSVLVYAGLILGPGRSREVVAVKQLPVVVVNRAGELWREVQAFQGISDPHLVNVKRALLLPGEADEGTSLWVVTEKCQGSILDLFPSGSISPSFLQAAFPPTGLNGLLHHLLRAVQTLHATSHGAHMRIHPGNIMVGSSGEVKLGDCAGKIRYLSVLDLLHAGLEGATNAKALLQWILGTPQETCWMAPELLTSLLDLDEELSQVMWLHAHAAEEGRSDKLFADVAKKFTWPVDFLMRADAWSAGKFAASLRCLLQLLFLQLLLRAGATLFYIASGGLHPCGSINDPLILANILADKKPNFEKLNNCPWLADLLAGLLCHKPSQRLSITQALHHPFFWTSEDIEKYLEDLRVTLESPRTTEASARLLDALSYNTNWVEALAYVPSPLPLLPLLLSYMAGPSASPQLLAAHPLQSASSFLVFLAHVCADRRMPLVDRRLIVSECLMAHAAPFLHSVYLFLFPKLASDSPAAPSFSLSGTGGPLNPQGPWPSPFTQNGEGLARAGVALGVGKPLPQVYGRPFGPAAAQHQQQPQQHNPFRTNFTGGPPEGPLSSRAVPPPPGCSVGEPGPAWSSELWLEQQSSGAPFRAAAPLGLHAVGPSGGGQAGEMGARAAAAGTDPSTGLLHRPPLLSTSSALSSQGPPARSKEAAAVRTQNQRASTQRGPQDLGGDSRAEGSNAGSRLAEEWGKKAGRQEGAKQRGPGSKELRWPGGNRQQNEGGRHPPGMGGRPPSSGLWSAAAAAPLGPPPRELLAAKANQPEAVRGPPHGAVSTVVEEKVAGGGGGPLSLTATNEQLPTPASSSASISASGGPQVTLEAGEEAEGKAAGSLQAEGGGPLPGEGYVEEAAASRKIAAHSEVKFTIGTSATLLQMPVAVSTVSTALSSATTTDFYHAQSQPTDGAGEGVGPWKQEQQRPVTSCPLPTQAAKEGRADPPQHPQTEAPAASVGNKRMTATAEDAATQPAAGDRDSVRRDTANPCSIQ